MKVKQIWGFNMSKPLLVVNFSLKNMKKSSKGWGDKGHFLVDVAECKQTKPRQIVQWWNKGEQKTKGNIMVALVEGAFGVQHG